MAISLTRYVNVTSGVGAGAVVSNRELILRAFTTNPLIPPATQIEYTFDELDLIGTTYGFESEEYLRAVFYCGWISKNITRAQKISFARYVNVDTAPYIFGEVQSQVLATYNLITNGSFGLTIGTDINTFTGLDFSAAASLADVANILQTAINTKTGDMWTGASVVFNATRGSFDFEGGEAAAVVISVQEGVGGTPVANLIGWLTGAILGNGTLAQSITATLTDSYNTSNNFGSFLFMQSLTLDQHVEAAIWTNGLNIRLMYLVPVTLANAASYYAALKNYGGVGVTISEINNSILESVIIGSNGQYSITPDYVFAGDGSGAIISPELRISSFNVADSGFDYVPGDTVLLAGGTQSVQAELTVLTTQLESFTLDDGGADFVIGDTLIFTDGTFATAAAVVVDTVDGGGAILTAHVSIKGEYTVNSAGTTYTTSGVGTGALFSGLSFGVKSLSISAPGDYTALPTNPVAQQSSSGTGSDATFDLSWEIFNIAVLNGGEGYNGSSTLTFSNGSPDAVVALDVQNVPGLSEYPEQAPAMILAATDYTAADSVQNYEFQEFDLTPSVSDDATADTLDSQRINYYGDTQQAGELTGVYQQGVLMGASTSPTDMNVFANEMWLKDAASVSLFRLLLILPKISANLQGVSQIRSTLQAVVNSALKNGTISVGKKITTEEQLFITEETQDPNAWYQVQSLGYWLSVSIVPFVAKNKSTQYMAVYILMYSKDDAIRKVDGTHVLI